MRKRPLCAICVLFLIIQAFRVLFSGAGDIEISELERAASGEAGVILTGSVYRIEKKEKVTAFYLKDNAVSAAGRELAEERVLVYYSGDTVKNVIKIGNILHVRGELQAFDSARNPGNFDQREYYRRQEIRVLVWAEQMEVLSKDTDRLRQSLYELRQAWDRLLVRHLGEYYGSTMSAILLGQKSGLDPEMKTMYQKCGISHILAISGLHMTFLGMGIYNALRRAGFGFTVSGAAGAVLLILYSLMIGAGVSSLRALIMFLVRIGAEITGRDYDLLTSLAVSAAVLCAGQPLYLTDAGFLLSYGAILGIALFAPVFAEVFGCEQIRKKQHWKSGVKKRISAALLWVLTGLSTSIAVNLMLLGPLLYFYFEIPPYSVFLNLIVIPLMPVAMGAGLFGSALALLWEPGGGAVLQICRAVLAAYDLVCEWSSGLPFGRIVTGRPDMWQLVLYYVMIALVLILYIRMKKREKERIGRPHGMALLLVSSGMILLCRGACREGFLSRDEVSVTVLDVGQGDCIHIRGPSADILIDGGSSDVSDVGTYRISPCLLSRGADSLDYVFVTHGDQDHISGIREMLEDQTFGVRICNLVLPSAKYHDEVLQGLAFTAAEAGTRVLVMDAEEKITDGGLTLECLAPEADAGLEPGNEASLVLEAEYGAFRMLFTGDVEGSGENALVSSGRLKRCDVLKAAHHGSKNSGSDGFLDIVQPSLTLISAGRDNRYGHPHAETVERLEKCGSKIYSTQEDGALTVRTDGRRIRISGTVSGGV